MGLEIVPFFYLVLMKPKVILFIALSFFLAISLRAQQDSIPQKKRQGALAVLPVVFFSPETNWGFGAGATYAFRFKGEPDSLRASQITTGAVYTLRKQLLTFFDFRFFLDKEKWSVYGESGFYIYTYNFFGIGGDTRKENEELYNATFPRIRVNALRRLNEKWYLGGRYWFDNYRITQRDSTGLLYQNELTGSEGGLISGLGLVANYDTRDDVFFPSKGQFVELASIVNSTALGSDFNFQRFTIDATHYQTITPKTILATNLFLVSTFGDPPFNELALMGGSKKMRGIFEGRFRDRNMVVLQTEYRFPLFWRFGMVAFGGVGGVAEEIGDYRLEEFKFTYGVGFRFRVSTKEKINVRADLGLGKNTSGIYITFSEAF